MKRQQDVRRTRLGAAAYAFTLSLVVMAAAGLVGLLVKQPFLFPSLGPTVMLFFDSPRQPAAAPKNTVVGHGVAILAGVGSLVVFGLTDHQPVIEEGISVARVGAAAVSVAVTVLVLRLLDRPHPPAGATTLIVSLGLLTSTGELLAMAAAVLLVTVLGVALDRLAATTCS